ncbi:adenylate cyclase associated N terminal-domain-containing protein [Kickxella alabastrina]|uniref:adenylate cyclase associated N terminal-domain-containing protein n=1 Tax=Kickxella alabastrina TaxID=61397 RepID=UPI002220009D|nr:adenylate cyclase associated N terminal-domain-containing protein [Kickxella alabastrina]KAI7834905.1 adenylate cyclase associated N terminal-domain-containing protein [Kickxella alabastrina]KAJ1947926.1 suppressor of rasval19 [Kickxella alabastrina]
MTVSNDLQSLLKRVEKATMRLEEMAAKHAEQKASAANTTGSSSNITDSNASLSSDAGADSKAVVEYEAALQPYVEKFIELSQQIGGLVGEQAESVSALFDAQRNFIRIAGLTKKPTMDQIPALLEPQQQAIQKAIDIKDKNRPSDMFDNLSTVAEGIAAFGWVAVEPTPVPYINEMKDSAQFYSNRVLKKWKEKDNRHVEWVKAFLSILREMAAYVKQFHTKGLVWNPKGEDSAQALHAIKGGAPAASSAAPPAFSGGAPPPAPPPPPPGAIEVAGSSLAAPVTRGALFADINKGGAITGGLRKVEKSEMTHKNPALRVGGTVQDKAESSSASKQAQPQAVAQRLPRMQLQGSKWIVENYGTEHLVIEATETKQTVYMFNCNGTTLEVKNKLNSIAIDGCQKCGIVFDTLVAQCEIVNCKSVQVQVRDMVASIQIDRTDGAHVFLSESARDNTQITTAKASEVNISFPYETSNVEDDNFVEQPIPEQLQTVVKDGKLVTTILEHTG